DEAREELHRITGGFESVPTLVFPDGSVLIEPSISQLKSRLARPDYDAPLSGMEKLLHRFRNLFRAS
ncbi:MAG TPA: hypothetical protein VJZ27_02430, partial [Aggregatilineales bacterium]|nr:hypothetical protein [Aggregatilineales bacterium]